MTRIEQLVSMTQELIELLKEMNQYEYVLKEVEKMYTTLDYKIDKNKITCIIDDCVFEIIDDGNKLMYTIDYLYFDNVLKVFHLLMAALKEGDIDKYNKITKSYESVLFKK